MRRIRLLLAMAAAAAAAVVGTAQAQTPEVRVEYSNTSRVTGEPPTTGPGEDVKFTLEWDDNAIPASGEFIRLRSEAPGAVISLQKKFSADPPQSFTGESTPLPSQDYIIEVSFKAPGKGPFIQYLGLRVEDLGGSELYAIPLRSESAECATARARITAVEPGLSQLQANSSVRTQGISAALDALMRSVDCRQAEEAAVSVEGILKELTRTAGSLESAQGQSSSRLVIISLLAFVVVGLIAALVIWFYLKNRALGGERISY